MLFLVVVINFQYKLAPINFKGLQNFHLILHISKFNNNYCIRCLKRNPNDQMHGQTQGLSMEKAIFSPLAIPLFRAD